MKNTSTATVAGHDEQARASWLAWRGLRVRVSLASAFRVGATVAWTISSDQVRPPSRSGKPCPLHEKPLNNSDRAVYLAGWKSKTRSSGHSSATSKA